MQEFEYQLENETKTVVREFASLDEFVTYGKEHGTFDRIGDRKFIGRDDIRSMDDAREQSNQAWTPGLERVDEVIEQLGQIASPKARKRKRRFNEDNGDDVCIDRLRSGQPFWQGYEKVSKTGPQTITIVVEYGAVSGVDSMLLMNKAAVAIAICDSLESVGYSVELKAYHLGHSRYTGGRSAVEIIDLKQAGEKVDVVSLVNSMSGWFYRTLAFQTMVIDCQTAQTTGAGGTWHPSREHLEQVCDVDASVLITGGYSLRDITNKALARLEEMGVIEN